MVCVLCVCHPRVKECFCPQKILHTLLARTIGQIQDSDRSGFKYWLDCFFLVLTLVKLLPATEGHSLLCKEGTEILPWRSSSVGCMKWYVTCPACNRARLWLMSASPEPLAAPQDLRPNQFYLQTQLQGCFQLCPPDLADPLGCILHLGSVSRTASALASTIHRHAPTWWCHTWKKWAQGQIGLGLHCVWGGGVVSRLASTCFPPPGPAREVLPANLSGDCPYA